MSGGVTVSGGGVDSVDTAEMQHARAVALRIGTEVGDVRGRLDRLLASTDAGRAADTLRLARAVADGIVARTAAIAVALDVAAARYGELERTVTAAVHAARSLEAAGFGAELRTAMVVSPALAVALIGGAVGTEAADAIRASWRSLIRDGVPNPFIDERFVEELGGQVGSVDDLVRGFLGIETPHDLVTDDPARPFSEQHIAAFLGGVLALIPGTSGAVRVTPTSRTVSTHLPRSLDQAVERVEEPQDGKPQIRIDQAGVGADRVAIVSVSGTVTFDPLRRGEPFDDVSNLELVGGATESPAEKAVLQAMASAGIGTDVPVLFVGHSQGALAATRAAQDGGYRVRGVITLGGPTAAVQLAPEIPVLALENTDDPVPRLGGTAQGVDHRVIVHRRSVDRANAFGILPSHERASYVETARLAEQSDDPRVTGILADLRPFFDGALASTDEYRADLVSGAAPSRQGGEGAAR